MFDQERLESQNQDDDRQQCRSIIHARVRLAAQIQLNRIKAR